MSFNNHTCHNTRCKKEVPKEKFACSVHWFSLPESIRKEINRHYRRGQCDDKKPSLEWLAAARAAIAFWDEKYRIKRKFYAEQNKNADHIRSIAREE